MSNIKEDLLVFEVSPKKRVKRAKIKDDGRTVELYQVDEKDYLKSKEEELFEELFPIVEASKLSLLDAFLKYIPETKNQENFYNEVVETIKSKPEDFRVPIYDPSFEMESDNSRITFLPDAVPAMNISPDAWKNIALKTIPNKNSRLGTRKQYIAFLAVLIKLLISEKKHSVAEAWKMVCDDSALLGHYHNSWSAKRSIEPTGCRKVIFWYDLANTSKILFDDEKGKFLLAAGNFNIYSYKKPLYYFDIIEHVFAVHNYCVGWIVTDV